MSNNNKCNKSYEEGVLKDGAKSHSPESDSPNTIGFRLDWTTKKCPIPDFATYTLTPLPISRDTFFIIFSDIS